MKIEDRWHLTRPNPKAETCKAHRKPMRAEHGKGPQWAVTVTVNGKRAKKFFTTKDAAQAFLEETGQARRSGSYVSPRDGRITFRDVARQYIDSKVSARTIRDSSRRILTYRLERYVNPALGDRRIGAINEADVEATIAGWRTDAGAPLAVSTHRGLVTDIRGVFRFAAAKRYVPKGFNPAADIKLPPKTRKRMVLPTEHAVELAAAAMPDRYRALLHLAVGTGLRRSEMLGITRDRISYTPTGRMVIEIDRQLEVRTTKAGPVFEKPKTSAGERLVLLTSALTEIMNRHMMSYCASDGLVFTVRGGAPLTPKYANTVLNTALRSAGLKPPVGEVTERAGFHQYRHLHTSEMIKAGEDPVTVAKRLGHEDIAVTFNTYSHLWDEAQESMVEKLEQREQEREERRRAAAGRPLRVVGGTDLAETPSEPPGGHVSPGRKHK